MKTHKTLTITKAWLKKAGACSEAIKELQKAGVLPAKVSTNPEANERLACKLVNAGIGWRVHWFRREVQNNPLFDRLRVMPDEDIHTHNKHGVIVAYRHATEDPFIVAQWLALSADHALTKQGR